MVGPVSLVRKTNCHGFYRALLATSEIRSYAAYSEVLNSRSVYWAWTSAQLQVAQKNYVNMDPRKGTVCRSSSRLHSRAHQR